MGLFDGIDLLNEQIGEVKETTKGIQKLEEKEFQLTPAGRRAMNADAYAMGEISLDEFIKREQEATFSISKDDFDTLSIQEQQKLADEHPEKIRKLLGK